MNRIQSILIGGSLAMHLGVYAWMGALPKEKKTSSVAIALAESKKKAEEAKPKPPPPPPPKPAEATPQKAKVAAPAEPKPAPEAAPPPPPSNNAPPPPAGDAPGAMDGFADFGNMALGTGGGGMAVPTGGGRGPAAAATQQAPVKKVKTLAPVAADECSEDPVKPQIEKQIQPAYSAEARTANVEGVVKVEITLDATGHVTGARVLKGLGFGLDEAAIAAAKQMSFKPATKCGKAVTYVVKTSFRFNLGS